MSISGDDIVAYYMTHVSDLDMALNSFVSEIIEPKITNTSQLWNVVYSGTLIQLTEWIYKPKITNKSSTEWMNTNTRCWANTLKRVYQYTKLMIANVDLGYKTKCKKVTLPQFYVLPI